jgi:DNA-binding winged helix-turn-helix (wHTH) protein
MRYTFGDCAFDTHLFTVQRAGQTRRLRPKVFQLLLYLVAHRDRVVSKPELCDQVWPGQFISEATLESHMRLVRQRLAIVAEPNASSRRATGTAIGLSVW